MITVVADTMNQRYEWTKTWDIAIVSWQSWQEVHEIQEKWLKVWKSEKEITIIWKIRGFWNTINKIPH